MIHSDPHDRGQPLHAGAQSAMFTSARAASLRVSATRDSGTHRIRPRAAAAGGRPHATPHPRAPVAVVVGVGGTAGVVSRHTRGVLVPRAKQQSASAQTAAADTRGAGSLASTPRVTLQDTSVDPVEAIKAVPDAPGVYAVYDDAGVVQCVPRLPWRWWRPTDAHVQPGKGTTFGEKPRCTVHPPVHEPGAPKAQPSIPGGWGATHGRKRAARGAGLWASHARRRPAWRRTWKICPS
jgi:hypothetical protein